MDYLGAEDRTPSKPLQDGLCTACSTITPESLLNTRPYKSGDNRVTIENDEVVEEHHIPEVQGIYHTLYLEDPQTTIQTCAACRLFHKACYGGITTSDSTVINLYLHPDRQYLEIRDEVKIQNELDRVEGTSEVPNLDGKGTVVIFTDNNSELAELFPGRRVGDPGSEESLAFIQNLADECDRHHPDCRIGLTGDVVDSEPEMPTRAVYVGSKDRSDWPRLVETQGMKARYVALSHAWGSVVKPYTTKSELPRLRHRIEYDSLPKTFRDAIFITRKLGINYIWIDSICIIQDDDEDWKREAAAMGLIYENAYLTISASTSVGDHEGFLTPHPDMNYDVRIQCRRGNNTNWFIYLRKFVHPEFEPAATRINHRGWVVQERILSRRILHFDELQVHWECPKHLVSEEGKEKEMSAWDKPAYWLHQNLKPLIRKKIDQYPVKEEKSDPDRWAALCKLYNFLVFTFREFSQCDLTYPKDKLPAVLGLVNEVRRATGMEYYDGHFFLDQRLLIYSLLWYTESFLCADKSPRPDRVRAPSWSWAAMEGNRIPHFYDSALSKPRKMLLEIKEVLGLKMRGLEPYHALLCSGRVVEARRSDYWIGTQGYRNELIKPPTSGHEILDPEEKRHFCEFSRRPRKGWVCFDDRANRPESFFLVGICECRLGEYNSYVNDCKECPVLVVAPDKLDDEKDSPAQRMVFKRIGLGALRDSAWFDEEKEVEFLLI